jgi:hypothetical protein
MNGVRATTRRIFCRAALVVACLAFATDASAIELFRKIPPPDDGRGSAVRGVNGGIIDPSPATSASRFVLGHQSLSDRVHSVSR